MKILFIAPANSIHTVRWVNALAERGHEMHLACLINHKNMNHDLNDAVTAYELPIPGTKGYYLNALKLRKLAAQIKPDVINVHYASGYGTLMRMAGLKQTLLSVWGSDVYEFPYQGRLQMHIIRKNLRSARAIASTSHCMADQTRAILKEEREIAVTPFGVNLPEYQEMKKTTSDTMLIGCIKTLEQKYGINYLIKAIRILIDDLQKENKHDIAKKIRCRIYGDGSQKAMLQKLIEDLKLENVVTLMGKIPHEQVPSTLAEMDIFCVLSEYESYGVAAVEASAAGLPVVVSDAPGFKEIIDNSVTGIVVEKKSPEKAAEALKKLVLNDKLRDSMGKEGRKRVEKLYDWNLNVSYMEELYHTLRR